MGKRGPARTPAHILRARGSVLTKYASQTTDGDTRENELTLPCNVPRMPPGLPDYAKRKWKYLTGKLSESKIINEIDGDTLERYVLELARYNRLEKAERRHLKAMAELPAAERFEDLKLIGILHKSSARCDALGKLFGLNPADRTRIQIERPPEEPAPKPKPIRPRLSGPPKLVAEA